MTVHVLLKRSAFLFFLLAAFAFFGGTAMAAAAPRIHISNNWTGYAATGNTYTGISATWTVPDPTTTSRVISADAAWVGIGGISKDDLIQAGTQAIIRNDRTEYIAWYELLPDTQRAVPLPIAAGDRIFASVNETAPGMWRITIANLTTGKAYQAVVPYASSHSSAEWIVERPLAVTGNATGYLPLSDFGDVTFENTLLTTASGKAQTISTSGAEQLIMSGSRSRLLAAPQQGSGSSFTVSYLTPSQGARYLRALRRDYTLQPETNVSSRSPHYQEIDTDYIIHIIFNQSF